MKVSVIVPVYNTEKYLEKCMGSLLEQTLDDMEIVAVDDGSTDRCGIILDQLQAAYPDRIKVFHKENGGQATARNLALKYCTGEYIGFLDSDDTADVNKYEIMYLTAKENDADCVACGYRDTTFSQGKQIVLREYIAPQSVRQITDMFFGALVSPWLYLYRRSLLAEHNIIFPEGYIYEDTAFYLNAIPYIRKFAAVEKPLATRVRRDGSTMTIVRGEKVAQIMPVLQASLDFYEKNGFMQEYGDELEYFCVRILLCSSMERVARVNSYQEGRGLVNQTIDFLHKNFPDFRKNPYMHGGLMHLYIKSFCGFTAGMYYPLFRLKAKFERRYE